MSKILSAQQLREADRQTILNEPISSTDLMERAATSVFNAVRKLYKDDLHFTVFCGIGNNGGDGLVIARLLTNIGCEVEVHIIRFSEKTTSDFDINLARLKELSSKIHEHNTIDNITIRTETVLIDALLGTGVTRKLDGILAHFVHIINESEAPVVSIDLPSGMFDDNNTEENRSVAVRATNTLSFQTIKYCFLLPENSINIGQWEIIDIGLDSSFIASTPTSREAIDIRMAHSILHERSDFAHKGSFGHALLCAGSKSMMGAAIMSTKSCLRSGAGLVSAFVPQCGYEIMQSSVPEAMTISSDKENTLSIHTFDTKFDAIGIGPGIGVSVDSFQFLESLLNQSAAPLVLDADALNSLAKHSKLLDAVSADSILTPHPKEFDRLFGPHNDTNSRIQTGINEAVSRKIYILLKGHHSVVITPTGNCYFNLSGNAGMATGGSGDVLTGILAGLRAQHYTAEQTCVLGVFLHGLAGDVAAQQVGEEALIATDIIEHIGAAFKLIHQE